MTKRAMMVGGGIAGILLVAGGILWYQGLLGGERALRLKISGNAELLELYDKARAREKEIAQSSEPKASWYLTLGLDWKSIAELGGPKEFFEKSLSVYEQGIDKFGQQNILFYINAGNIARRLDDFAKAERYYRKAMDLSPADESGYISLAELYEYSLKKPASAVLDVFHAGEKKMVNPTPLIAAEATFLRRQGDAAGALAVYRVLAKAFPDHQGYKEIISELESAVAASTTPR